MALAESGQSGEIYNIANGDYKSLKRIYGGSKNLNCAGNNNSVWCKIIQWSDIETFCGKKIYKDTGWKAEVSFIDGIRKAYL